jgi:two-component system sensor kinase FixL
VQTAGDPDEEAEVVVTDTGPGISPDRLPWLFDAFFTTKEYGMGLGLSIARSIIEAHGGCIWAENNADGGATFRFTLPIAARLERQNSENATVG